MRKWVKHVLVPIGNFVSFTEVMETLKHFLVLYIFDSFNKEPDVEEFRLVLLLLDISEHVESSLFVFHGHLIFDFFFQGVLRANN